MDQPLSAVSLGGGRWRENTTSLERCVAISGRTTEVPFTITELCCARSTGFPARRVTSGSTGICGPGHAGDRHGAGGRCEIRHFEGDVVDTWPRIFPEEGIARRKQSQCRAAHSEDGRPSSGVARLAVGAAQAEITGQRRSRRAHRIEGEADPLLVVTEECLARRGGEPARAIVTPDAPPAIAARGSACP